MRPFGCRTRTKYTQEQVVVLERAFEETHYPNIDILDSLSLKLDVALDKLNIWFQNRRSKFKKQSKGNHVGWMRTQIFKENCKNGARHVLSSPCLTNSSKPLANLDYFAMDWSPLNYSHRLAREGCFSPAPPGGGSLDLKQTAVGQRLLETTHFHLASLIQPTKENSSELTNFPNDLCSMDYLGLETTPPPPPFFGNTGLQTTPSPLPFSRDTGLQTTPSPLSFSRNTVLQTTPSPLSFSRVAGSQRTPSPLPFSRDTGLQTTPSPLSFSRNTVLKTTPSPLPFSRDTGLQTIPFPLLFSRDTGLKATPSPLPFSRNAGLQTTPSPLPFSRNTVMASIGVLNLTTDFQSSDQTKPQNCFEPLASLREKIDSASVPPNGALVIPPILPALHRRPIGRPLEELPLTLAPLSPSSPELSMTPESLESPYSAPSIWFDWPHSPFALSLYHLPVSKVSKTSAQNQPSNHYRHVQ